MEPGMRKNAMESVISVFASEAVCPVTAFPLQLL